MAPSFERRLIRLLRSHRWFLHLISTPAPLQLNQLLSTRLIFAEQTRTPPPATRSRGVFSGCRVLPGVIDGRKRGAVKMMDKHVPPVSYFSAVFPIKGADGLSESALITCSRPVNESRLKNLLLRLKTNIFNIYTVARRQTRAGFP